MFEVGADEGCLDCFLLYVISFYCLPLSGRELDIN